MTTKHTPEPWRVIEQPDENGYAVEGAARELVACDVSLVDAEFIACACNNHDALLAALQLFVAQETGNEGNEPSDAMLAARAAIAKVQP